MESPPTSPSPSAHPGMGAIPYAGGATFRVWAPHAGGVEVVGEFNDWSQQANPLTSGEMVTGLPT